ncbi:hypothetical protein B0H13DRAFT_1858326 [Mycena leptocephala]|nr:hypothetical protein B0H13DRAFT_1858326 [Mycena leptocephala]
MADITSIPLEHTATRNSGINAGTAESAKEQIKRTAGNSQRAMRAQTNKRLGTTSKKLGTAKGILGTANGQLGTANGKLANGKLGTTNGKLGSTASGKLRTANGKLGSANWVTGLPSIMQKTDRVGASTKYYRSIKGAEIDNGISTKVPGMPGGPMYQVSKSNCEKSRS